MAKIKNLIVPMMLTLISCTSMGSDPDGERLKKIQQSPQYNKMDEQFQNPVKTPLSTGRSFTEIFFDFFFTSNNRRPEQKLPELPPALTALDSKSDDVRFIWFGHSSILLEIDSVRILVDPVFSEYASPIPSFAKRFQPPVFELEKIPDIDIVLISHDHYDHLDYETIDELKTRNIHYVVPIGVGAHLEGWGINKTKITELDWWQSIRIGSLEFTCTPSQHFSGRGLFNNNTTLWSSWSLQGKSKRVFFSGDSGYGAHYKEIGDRLGPFDIAFLENGAYSVDWKFVHQLPEETVQANIDLKSNKLVPVHWGMFDLALHSWHEPIERVTAEAKRKGVEVIAPKLGQLVYVDTPFEFLDWWSAIITVAGE